MSEPIRPQIAGSTTHSVNANSVSATRRTKKSEMVLTNLKKYSAQLISFEKKEISYFEVSKKMDQIVKKFSSNDLSEISRRLGEKAPKWVTRADIRGDELPRPTRTPKQQVIGHR